MKSKAIALVFVAMLICIYSGCSNNQQHAQNEALSERQASNYHKIDFLKFIEQHKNDSLDYYEELLSNKDFVNILEHSKFYFTDVISYLYSGRFNTLQVSICICAMQNFDLNNYLDFCNVVLSLYDQNKLSEGVLEHAISPDFLRKRIIINNYDNPAVIKLLESIKNNNKVSDKNFLNGIPDILSGKSAKELKEFDEESNSN